MMKKAAPELEEIWEQQDEWYSKAVQYWDKQEASVEGVLGGFGFVSEPDIADSLSLLLRVSHRSYPRQKINPISLYCCICIHYQNSRSVDESRRVDDNQGIDAPGSMLHTKQAPAV